MARKENAPKEAKLDDELAALTRKWNDALAKRDADALKPLYGAKVRLYEDAVDRDAVVKRKAAAFATAKDYTQSISALEIDLRDAKKPKAAFDKKWTQQGKTSSVRGSLAFANEGGSWVIVEESDAKTDAKRARALSKTSADACEAAVFAVVESTARGKELLATPLGAGSNWGMRFDNTPPSTVYSVAIHESTPERLVTYGWFEVDAKSGVVKSTMPEDEVVRADAAAVAKMQKACTK